MTALCIEQDVPLAPHTTLELGGPAAHFARIHTRQALLDALRWAQERALPVTVLGGGSNVIVSDRGVSGLVLKLATRGVEVRPAEAAESEACWVEAEAGENWDGLVERCVSEQLAGIECLSGIPGSVGAAPVQNIGAYGQELADCVRSIEVLDLRDLRISRLNHSDCQFDYRTSRWKRAPGRELVLSVQLQLTRGDAGPIRYAELARALAPRAAGAPALVEIRQAVLALRRAKSMLLDPTDENRRSAGSFFLNPIVSASEAERVAQCALARGQVTQVSDMPRYPAPAGQVKLSAAWLIERAGTHKGERQGAVGVSSRHCLALVHHGGGTSAALLALAATLQTRVRDIFGAELVPEPVMLGFD